MLDIRGLEKKFGKFHLRVNEMQIKEGSYVVILGDSGSGKSLLLEILSGLVQPDAGTIAVNDQEIVTVAPNRRPFGLVFQDHNLFPHLTVRANIQYPLDHTRMKKNLKKEAVLDTARKLEAAHLLDRYPDTLSGGEKQRVSLARTLITKPLCLLLDEPLSALDAKLKKEIRSLLRWINRNGQTILHVTHDYDEAISLASHIGVMDQGEIVQFGTAEEILSQPRSSFVANFTGVHNYFKVSLGESVNGECLATTEDGINVAISSEKSGGQGYIIIPSESIVLSFNRIDVSSANQFKGVVKEITPARYGIEVRIEADLPVVTRITHNTLQKMNLSEGQTVWYSFKASSVQYINK